MEKNKNVHEVVIKIDGERWENALDAAFKEKNKKAKIDGFRPGKAPKDVYIKHYGVESLFISAAEGMLNDAYLEALSVNKLEPVCQPKFDIKNVNDKECEYVFTITTKPSLEIKKYKGLKVEKMDTKATNEEVDHEISHLLEKYSDLVNKDGKVENGDFAVIDFEGFKDGVAFEGGKGENYTLEIGSNTFIPGFEDQLIGMKKEETKDINVTFPEDYQSKELAGAACVFKITVHEIKVRETRKMDEELFEDLGMEGVTSEETLRAEIKKGIEAKKETDAENKYVDDLLAKIAENTTCDIPEGMIDDEIHHLIHRFEDNMKMQGISLELYYEITKTTHEDLHKQFEAEAKKNVLYRLILEELIKVENITVTEDEAKDEANKLAEKYNMKTEDLLKEFGGLDMIMYDTQVRRCFDKLKEYNK